MAFGFGFGMPRSFAVPQFSPLSLFANGEQGWWYDPSNYGPTGTLFQDSAGTTPVTAVEQPVGLQLDLSKGLVLGPELIAGAPTPSGLNTVVADGDFYKITYVDSIFGAAWSVPSSETANKTLLITFTAFTNAGSSITVRVNHSGAPQDTTINSETPLTKSYRLYGASSLQVGVLNFAAGEIAWIKVSVKELPGNHRFQTTSANRPVVSARVNLFVGTATLATQSVTTRATTHTLTFTGAGSITLTGTAIGIYTAGTYSVTTTAGTLTATVLGTVTQADLRETNVGVGLPAYQAVVTSTNYDSTGFPVYIKPNGSNQFMQTNSINFTATDKMTVWQGVRKLSDAATALPIELSVNAASNNGAFFVAAPVSANPNYQFTTRGTALASASYTDASIAAPVTNVLTSIGDISGDVATLRVNAVQVNTSSSDQGTGNYGTYPAYFYSRAGTGFFFNGNDYGSIARGAASTAAQIANGEAYINSLTKAFA